MSLRSCGLRATSTLRQRREIDCAARSPVDLLDDGFDELAEGLQDVGGPLRLDPVWRGAALDAGAMQPVGLVLVDQNGHRRCCENESCHPQIVHVSPPLILLWAYRYSQKSKVRLAQSRGFERVR